MLDWFRGRNNAETGPRDGEAPVLELMALSETDAAPVPSRAGEPVLGPRDRQRDILLRTLSAKVLNVHLANRFQTSYPLALNFQSLEPGAAALLVEVAATAILADPRTASQPQAVRSRMVEAQASETLLAAFDEALIRPRALSLVLPEIVAAGLSSHAYAASLIALGRPTATGRHHLAYLAARLGLGEEIVASLRRRYQG
ncbi:MULTISPECIES: hypothetical protein [unclassified Aureimonas]|uniref:hypothetical protein n=1 Tax=unclassified Aureimonas TaxID=2615206 RepID=UPI0006F8BF58|nr:MULTISPECIES: hypothetical protein [unclassified Aureimonas]KQT53019.1 hypothetical protein ASG62_14045 [Aureimonas sp. Leaf427]KQT80475.1 hypothetical protein ASG54_07895 [Aureimonas sp. Leaf460]